MAAQAGPEGIDPVTVEVIRHYISSTAKQMRENLIRTAYNPTIYEILDFGISVYDTELNLVGSAPGLEVIGLGNDYSIRKTVEHVDTDDLGPGDIVLMNYPYWNTRQPNDACLIQPIFRDDELVNYLLVRSHWVDIGAKDQGYVLDSTNVHQEGILFPGVKLYDGGEPVEDIFDIIRFNSRMPEKVLGDINAKISSLKTGQERLNELYEKYDVETVARASSFVLEHSERKARRAVEELPDGTWSAVTFLDTDGVSKEKIRLEVTVTIDGDEVVFDFSGSDDVVPGPINVPLGMTEGICKFWLKRLATPETSPNEGDYAPLKDVIAPEGNLFNATYPAPTFSILGAIGGIELVLKALAKGMPERLMAGSGGDLCGFKFVGENPETGEMLWLGSNEGSGWGATDSSDGQNGVIHVSESGARNIPIEVLETKAPARVERFQLRQDSGGPGEHRGGLGIRRDYTFTSTVDVLSLTLSSQSEGWGLEGGEGGARNQFVFYPAERWGDRIKTYSDLDGAETIEDGGRKIGMFRGTVIPGERVAVCSGGGGGYGRPADRDPEQVLHDVREGYVSREQARREYGVEITPDETIDWEQTNVLRSD